MSRRVASWVRCGLALLLLAAGIAKLVDGTPLALEAMRMFALHDSHWPQLSRGVEAIAVLEILLATAMLVFVKPGRWMLTLLLVESAFIGWDVLRYSTGGTPDCGCFGGITLAASWLHVWLKHVILLVLIGYVWSALREPDARTTLPKTTPLATES